MTSVATMSPRLTAGLTPGDVRKHDDGGVIKLAEPLLGEHGRALALVQRLDRGALMLAPATMRLAWV